MCVFVGVLQGMHDMFISPAGGEPSAVLHAPATSGQCLQRKRKLDQIGSGYSSTASSYTVTATAVPAQTLAAKHLSHQVRLPLLAFLARWKELASLWYLDASGIIVSG